jgi:uncharacterized protein DUF5916/cellulose/xylan binding protein with CBM9 domain
MRESLTSGGCRYALVLLTVCAVSTNAAQTDETISTDNPPKSVCLELQQAADAPVIDGVLDDAVWIHATRIDDLHQFQPVDHGEPTEKSEFRLFYDKDFLYLGARLYDRTPDAIRARQLVQGGTLRFDDAIEFLLDPFETHRTGYWFQLNPNGIRRDGLYEGPTSINRDWDGIWLGKSRVDEFGWTAEVAIPFKTLNFNPDSSKWGFTVARTIARKKEEIAWSSFDRAINPGSAGFLDCISNIRQGRGLDIVPSVALKRTTEFAAGTAVSNVEPSLDVYYKITPSLTAALTLNTDFSATEVDDRQVNLTRFSLFFPEKRQFFNQDVDIFSFGGLTENGRPFFPRRIGLSTAGDPVDIVAGAKLSGRIGRWNVGVLNVLQDAAATVDKSNVFVARASANVLQESSVGVIYTNGNPTANLDNQLFGADFRYRNTSLIPGSAIQGMAWYQRSDTEGVSSDQEAYGWRVEYPNSERWLGELGQWVIEENFSPAAGFVNRANIVGSKAEAGYTFTPNGRFFRNITIKSIYENIDTIGGALESREFVLEPFSVETQFGDFFEIRLKRLDEVLVDEFEISPGVMIGTGAYTFDRIQFALASALERRFALNMNVDIGEFYDGDLVKIAGDLNWRPGRHLFLQLGYEFNDVELPQGSFTTRLYRARVDFAFNAYWSWLNFLQYDNITDTAGINSRVRFNPQAGRDMYFVVNRQFDVDPLSRKLRSSTSEIVLKFLYTFRF